MSSFITRLLPLPVVGILLALTVVLIVRLYRRDRARVSRATGYSLVAMRVLTGVLLVLLIADPVRVARRITTERNRLFLAIDVSRSFDLREPSRPATQVEAEARALGVASTEIRTASRRELASRVLQSEWIKALENRFEISYLALSTSLVPFTDSLPPTAGGTDLLGPLADEVAHTQDGSLAGMILFTDGHHHGPGDQRQSLERLRRLEIPIVSVGIGAQELPGDLAVEAVDATGIFFTGDEVKALVTIAAVGIEAVETELSVLEGETPLTTAPIKLPAGSSRTQWPVSFAAGAPGRKKLTVRVAKAQGEELESNNSRHLWLDVLNTRAKVLLVDGAPRWEQRYLRSTWSREKPIELSSFLVTPPPERRLPAEFPRDREALFAFDVIVLGDVEPNLLARDEIALLRDFVAARGGTLVLIAGERAMPYRWNETAIAEILPIQLLQPPPPSGAGRPLTSDEARFRLTAVGETAEITRLVPGREANLELWKLLVGPGWICPTLGARPGAEVLVTVQDAPVILTRPFGAGRVFFSGIDCTWKWRFKFGDELHRRFWGQVIRWAVSRQLMAADDVVQLGTNAASYSPTTKIRIEALLRHPPANEQGETVDAVLEEISSNKQARLRLQPIAQSGGRYVGETTLAEIDPGAEASQGLEYRVWIDAPSLSSHAGRQDRAEVRFVIEPVNDLEVMDLGVNTALLEEIAAATGGKSLPLARFNEAAQDFQQSTRSVERTLEISPLSSWPALAALLLLGLLALEWTLRKRRELL